jgi:hypothetical protein
MYVTTDAKEKGKYKKKDSATAEDAYGGADLEAVIV